MTQPSQEKHTKKYKDKSCNLKIQNDKHKGPTGLYELFQSTVPIEESAHWHLTQF